MPCSPELIGTVYISEAVLIGNRASLADTVKRKNIDRLRIRLKAALAAHSFKYVMMDAPPRHPRPDQAVIPDLKSLTVVDLADPDWVTVHAVIPAEMFWDVVERLRELGASQILATPIESMIM